MLTIVDFVLILLTHGVWAYHCTTRGPLILSYIPVVRARQYVSFYFVFYFTSVIPLIFSKRLLLFLCSFLAGNFYFVLDF